MKDFYLLSLYEIYNSNQKQELINLCLKALNDLKDNRILKTLSQYQMFTSQLHQLLTDQIDIKFLENYQISINDIYTNYQESYNKNLSRYFFNNSLTCFYPNIKLIKAQKQTICHFDGTSISPGTEYIYYRPLIDNIETHQSFVLATTIKVTPDYEYILPTNISELEDFNINLKNRLYQSSIYSDIDFYELSNNLRANELKLIKLKKKR